MAYDVLKEIYRRLEVNPTDTLKGLKMYHSDIYYIKQLVNSKFNTEYSEQDIFQLLLEEGLILEEDKYKYVINAGLED